MSTQLTLTITDLELRLSKFKLGPLNMHVPMGAVHGLIGPDGAAKTTAYGTPTTRFQWLP